VRAKGLRQLGYSVNAEAATRASRADVALAVLEGGEHNQASWARMLPGFLRWAYAVHAPPITATGTVEGWQDVPSRHVPARNVDVWLPPSYGTDPQRRYPVLYMHDGQNLFDPALSYTGIDWGVDEAMTQLVAAGQAREAIVVGIWNTPLRGLEYTPRAPAAIAQAGGKLANEAPADRLLSDGYVAFLVDELKPFIDAQYRTLPGRDDTYIMGSSLGSLISLYAVAQHPQVYGGVGAVSTHWPNNDGAMVDWFGAHLPDPRTHRLWFDHGTATLDAQYGPYQQRMDALLKTGGYVRGRNWETFVDEGAEHNERAWRGRLDKPLRFLLGTQR
jgi:predicted alpha/beta superfamily hydrolase